jgi:hypothetical protein
MGMTTGNGHSDELLDLNAPPPGREAEQEAFVPPTGRRRFQAKDREGQLDDVSEAYPGTKRRAWSEARQYQTGDRLHGDPFADLRLTKSERFRGDWTASTLGTIFRYAFLCALVVGTIWGLILLWIYNIGLLMVVILFLALLYGVIRAGLELGEKSPFNYPAYFFGRFWPWLTL